MKVMVEWVRGVEGNCLVVNGCRVAGPKPWGGGKVIESFEVEVSELHIQRLAEESRKVNE